MGYLAIIGFPGFSGFWSKDKIIEVALTESWLVGLCALLGAGITGFYMTRLMLMTFFGEKRWAKDVHPHESPKVMTFPLIVLAALSVLGGVMLIGGWIEDFLAPVVGRGSARRAADPGARDHRPRRGRRGHRRRPSRSCSSAGARSRARLRRTSRSSPARPAPTSTATRSTTSSWSSPARV